MKSMGVIRMRSEWTGLQLRHQMFLPPMRHHQVVETEYSNILPTATSWMHSLAGGQPNAEELTAERTRLTQIDVHFVTTSRSGQLINHGPGQFVGYPFLDPGPTSPTMGIRNYVWVYLARERGLQDIPSECTSLFLGAMGWKLKTVQANGMVESTAATFGSMYGRDMERSKVESAGELG
ncbi:hypothetical protein EDC04DRAFT_2599086 [Pisolithus marmoratus]|nr:hypothetical protein EDC04DRAFT_2599086 [Pisolithus marmoratus]